MRERLQNLSRMTVIALLATAMSGAVSLADKLVDPSKVAPEFREAAEKRRAEQIRIINCNNEAKIANIPARESLKFMQDCVDRTDVAPSDISSSMKK
ncbi:MAG: hypothetical protein HY242_15345 [Afipia sp.]|nr:hypothetical protein [Afipia sp.]